MGLKRVERRVAGEGSGTGETVVPPLELSTSRSPSRQNGEPSTTAARTMAALRLLRQRLQVLQSARLQHPQSSSALTSALNGRKVMSRVQVRTLVAAPKAGDGPLMERRGDRELPDIRARTHPFLKTLPIFLAIVTASTLAIFNYQKQSSSVISSSLYALRQSPTARSTLGNNIYFKHKIPWIWGEINYLKGKVDIHFSVKGDAKSGMMKFVSIRENGRKGNFVTKEWSLEVDGQKIDLLKESNAAFVEEGKM